MYHREERIALSAEVGIEAEHEAHHHAVDAVAAQVAGCHVDHGGIVCEDACQRRRQELRVDTHGQAERQGHPDARPEAARHASDEPCAVVLCRHGGHGCGDGRGRKHGKYDDFLHDAHMVDDDRNQEERDVYQRILQGDGCAELRDLSGEEAVRPDVAPAEREVESPAVEKPQGRQEADALRQHRGDGGTGRTQPEAPDQQEVDPDVDDAGDEHEVERRLRVAQHAHEAVSIRHSSPTSSLMLSAAISRCKEGSTFGRMQISGARTCIICPRGGKMQAFCGGH